MNYTGLSKLVDEFGSQGFKVLAFPCNQFNSQEPGTNDEVLDFVERKFGAKDKFTFFEKGNVNGEETREVFSFLKQNLPNSDESTDVRWNFAKFLVDHEGSPVKRFSSQEKPSSMKERIEELLKKKEETTEGQK